MKRYSNIGNRLGRLYSLIFSITFKDDLIEAGYGHIYDHLTLLQEKRNGFIHGEPEAITEKLVHDTILYLQDSQLAWITLYNKRCTNKNFNPNFLHKTALKIN